jgi:hypothetical protein
MIDGNIIEFLIDGTLMVGVQQTSGTIALVG